MQIKVRSLLFNIITYVSGFSLVTNCCYKLLENPEINHAVNKDTRTALCHVLGVMVKRYNHGFGNAATMFLACQGFLVGGGVNE